MSEETVQAAEVAEEVTANVEVKSEEEPVETPAKENVEENKQEDVEVKEEKVEENAENGENEEKKEEEVEKPSNPVGISQSSLPKAQSQYIRLRGLPFDAIEKDIAEFFEDLKFERVKFRLMHGRPSGEAYVEFKNKEDAARAMTFDRKEIKTRYIEVFTVAESEGDYAWRPEPVNTEGGEENHVVRLRGVPWSCKEDDINNFFEGLEPPPAEIVIGGTGGPKSRPSGEAFVRFTSAAAAQKAMEYNKKHMGSRYIEVFPSSMIELNREKGFGNIGNASSVSSYERTGIRPLMSLDRSDPPYGGGGGYGGSGGYGGGYDDHRGGYGGHSDYGYGSGGGGYDQGGYGGQDYGNGGADPLRIYMRGLPYDADGHAIEAFFSPLRVQSVKLGINEQGRPSGDAIAEFEQYNDMVSAMNKNNQRMGRRYVELFYTRDAPAPMRRLLWKDSASSMSSAPIPDPVLSGRRGGRPPHQSRDPYRQAAPARDSWAQRSSYDNRGAPPARGGMGGGRGGAQAPRAPRADPWGSYGASAQQQQPQQQQSSGYGGWEGYGYSAGAQTGYGATGGAAGAAGGYGQSAGGYERQRESRDQQSAWTHSQNSYGGWGAGSDQRGGY